MTSSPIATTPDAALLDPALLDLLIEEHLEFHLPRLERFWDYYRNPLEEVSSRGESGRWYALGQEQGLRVTVSLQSPVPVQVLRWRGNPFAGAGPQRTFDLGNTFEFRAGCRNEHLFCSSPTGREFFSQGCNRSDRAALNDWLISRIRREDLAGDANSRGKAVLTLAGVWPLLRPGDRLINTGGDGIDAAGRSEAIAQRGATVQSVACHWSSGHDTPGAAAASTVIQLAF